MQPNICLGTAQFGMNYGITNKNGKIKSKEIREILEFANENNICYLDTAQSYGNAEQLLGKNLQFKNNFKIITKFKPFDGKVWDSVSISKIRDEFFRSLDKLKVDHLDTILFHNSFDLRIDGKEYLYDWLKEIKEEGLVTRIGISIYKDKDLKDIPLEIIQIVQLPLSIYDQSLLRSGLINKLKKNDISIHARSIFLQGILLQRSNFPTFLSKEMYAHHSKLIYFLDKNNISLLDASLAFIKSFSQLEAFVVGISSKKELIEITNSFLNLENKNMNFFEELKSFSWSNQNDIDPRLWEIDK